MKKKKDRTIERNLNYIRRKGDLYDVISKKRNATPDTFARKLLKIHTIIFSRILYLFLVYTRRIKNSFAPVKKIKNIQDEIREIIGLPVDIYRNKVKKSELGLIYCNYNLEESDKYPDIEDLIYDLGILGNFSKEHEINDIYIEKYYLSRYLSDEFLWNFKSTSYSEILKHTDYSHPNYLLVKVTPKELESIIAKIKENKYDNVFIYSLKDKLKSEVTKEAIDDFKRTNNGEKLLKVVKSELFKLINDDSTVKDRTYGKVHHSYELGETFLRRTTTDSEGNFISQNIITLYNFLEVTNYSHLEDVAFIQSEDQELKLVSLLYLHLLGENFKEKKEKIKFYPLYDYIYDQYKSTSFYKKIPWINTLLEKRKSEGPQYVMSIFSVILTYIMVMLGIYIPNHWLPLKSQTLDDYNNFINKIKNAYEESYDFEQNIKKSIQQYIEKLLPKDTEKEIRKSYQETIQQEHKDTENGKIAEIEWFSKERMPVYFIDQYSDSGRIYNGEFSFWMKDPIVNYWDLVDVRPLFQVKCPISKEELERYLDNIYFHLPLEACPVGNEYALTQIYIKDESDPTNYLKIDREWNDHHQAKISDEEKEIIKSIKEPMVYYVYGLSNESNMQIPIESSYTDMNPHYVKEAILEGLGLSSNATDEEINQVIVEKDYTKYPLYNKKKDIKESEYYKEIASLSAIDVDMASILTTMANENSMYVSGFKNANEDEELTLDEAYTWVINEDGEIIDFIANFTEKQEFEINAQESEWLEYNKEPEEKEFVSPEQKENQEQNYDFTEEVNEEIKEEVKNNDSEEIESQEEESRIKETFNKISVWAKEHHISYYVACFIALLIIKKIFGKKIKFKMQLAKSNRILTDEDFANTYSELFQFVYGEELIPKKRDKSKILDIIYKEFYCMSEDDINSLLKELKPLIKANKEATSLKKVEELLKMIPFIKENWEDIEEYEPKKLTLGGRHEK